MMASSWWWIAVLCFFASSLRPALSFVSLTSARLLPCRRSASDDSAPAEEESAEAAPGRRRHKDYLFPEGGKPSDGFMMATRALRGEFDPVDAEVDNERSAQLFTSALMAYPATQSFTAVGKLREDQTPDFFTQSLVALVKAETGTDVSCDVKSRLNGRYLSVRLHCQVASPDVAQRVLDRLANHDSVTFSF